MKKVLYIIMVLLCLISITWYVNNANAQEPEIHYELTIVWQDHNVKPKNFQWLVYMRDENTPFDLPVMVIPLADAVEVDGKYQTVNSTINIKGDPGSTVSKIFALKSQVGENKSNFSNESIASFQIPLNAPFGVNVKINILSK